LGIPITDVKLKIKFPVCLIKYNIANT